jgi:hypothetical protein
MMSNVNPALPLSTLFFLAGSGLVVVVNKASNLSDGDRRIATLACVALILIGGQCRKVEQARN